MSVMISAIGVSYLLENLATYITGGLAKAYPVIPFLKKTFTVGQMTIKTITVITPVLTIFLVVALVSFISRTKTGMAMRAVSKDFDTARLMGIRVNDVISYTFVIGSFLAGVGSILYFTNYGQVSPLIGAMPGLKAFVAADSFPIKQTDKIKIVYVGILQDFRLLKEITDCIAEDKRFEFHVGGFGKYEQFFTEKSQKYDNIFFYGKLSYEKTLSLENECDIMLAVYDPSIENHRFAAPNKFYESLMLGKPVVMVLETGMSNIVATNNLGVLIEYSKTGFKDGLNKLIACKTEWNEMGKRANKIYNEKYSWSEMSKRLIRLYESI